MRQYFSIAVGVISRLLIYNMKVNDGQLEKKKPLVRVKKSDLGILKDGPLHYQLREDGVMVRNIADFY